MIHHYFGSKQGLLAAIVERFSSNVFAVQLRLLETPPTSQQDFTVRLELLFRTTLDAYIDHRPKQGPALLPDHIVH